MSLCGNPECGSSSGIHEGSTFGRGKLDDYGYWEIPCNECARKYELLYPEYGSAWPFERNEKGEILQKRIIYTIGHTESYLKYFEEQGTPEKKGRDSSCPGGSVWETREEAEKHCQEGYSVFGVFADWEKETVPTKKGWNDLLVDAPLIKIDKEK